MIFWLGYNENATAGTDEGEGRRALSAVRALQAAQLTEAQMQGFIGEYLEYLTDGAVVCTAENGVVTTRVEGPCAEIQPLLEEVVNSLLLGMSVHFGTTFTYMGVSCETTVVAAPSPPPPVPPTRPPPLSPTGAAGLSDLVISMNVGWTWISLNVVAADMAVNTVFKDLALVDGDNVKSQFFFTQYYAGYGFFGTLDALTTDSMYGVKLTAPATVTVSGTPVALPKTISLNGQGWTFMPCPYETAMTLQIGLPIGVAFSTEDQIKSQFQFSTYYAGYGWFGSLKSIDPSRGYMLKLSGAGGQATYQP